MRRFTLEIMEHSFEIEIRREDERHFSVTVNKETYSGTIEDESENTLLLAVEGGLYTVEFEKEPHMDSFTTVVNCRKRTVTARNLKGAPTVSVTPKMDVKRAREMATDMIKESRGSGISGGILAPMPGKIVKVNVRKGDDIRAGDVVLVLEAMKMENEILADRNGRVTEVRVSEGDSVDSNDVLVVIG